MMWLMRFPDGRKKALTFSYDDGVRQDKRLVKIMNKYGVKGTFNINSGRVAENSIRPNGEEKGRMSLEEAKACYADGGHEVAVHGFTHPFLEQVPLDSVAYEIIKDREILEREFGCIVKGMAYPMGTLNNEVVNVLKSCGISYARTTVSTEKFDIPSDWLRMPATCHHNHPKLMEFADSFLNLNVNWSPKLFYLWGHSYEFDNNNNWETIEKFCQTVGGHEDIWYATNMQIYEYVEAYYRLKTSADGKIIHNPTSTTVWFANEQGETFSVLPGQITTI